MNLYLLVVSAATLALAAAQCNDKNPTMCSRKKTELQAEMRRRGITDIRTSFDGNFCSANSDAFSMRDYWCCGTCRDLYAGQQDKEVSYKQTPSGETCQDTDQGRGYCTRLIATTARVAQFCPYGKLGYRKCKESCGWCAQTSMSAAVSTAASCVAGTACSNSSVCTRYGATASTTQGCTSDGTNTGTLGVGLCQCAECSSTAFNNCTGDADCTGGIAHACEATVGECNCTQHASCKVGTACNTNLDADCGNVNGACGKIDATALTFSTCAAGDTGCECRICPGTKPCYGDTSPCTAATAAATCGDAQFCVDTTNGGVCTGTTCACSCVPTKIGDGTADGKTALSCVDGTVCGNDATAKYACGDIANCVVTGSTTACDKAVADKACTCSCSIKKIEHPNSCLGAVQDSAGVKKTCSLTSTTDCALNVVLGFPDATPGICVPSYTTGATCSCGSPIYPKSSTYVGKVCTSYTDCQSTTDTACMCDTTQADAANRKCVLSDATNIALLDGSTPAKSCSTDLMCGWGKCVDTTTFKACATGGTCKCIAAGCDSATTNSCSIDDSTVCGLSGDCAGKCSCA